MKIKMHPKPLKRCLIDLVVDGIPQSLLKDRYQTGRSSISRYHNLFLASALSHEQLKAMNPYDLHNKLSSLIMRKYIDDSGYSYREANILLKETKYLTKEKLWYQYIEMYPNGRKYSHFCETLNKNMLTFKSYNRGIHYAGDEMMIDMAGKPLQYHDEHGVVVKAKIFVAVLPFSNRIFYALVDDETNKSWLKGISQAFDFYNGVPSTIICDNATALVSKPGKIPDLNRSFMMFLDDYGTTATPCDIYSPRQKAKVENAVLIYCRYACMYLYKDIFSSRKLAEDYVSEMTKKINLKPMRDYQNQTREERFFSLEADKLSMLPSFPFEYREEIFVQVGSDGIFTIKCDGHSYNVPYSYSGFRLRVELFEDRVMVYHEFIKVCKHIRSYEIGKTTINPDFLHPKQRAYYYWDYLEACETLIVRGFPSAANYLKEFCAHNTSHKMRTNFNQGLELLISENSDIIEAACQRAEKMGDNKVSIGLLVVSLKLEGNKHNSEKLVEPEHENLRNPNDYNVEEL